MHSARLALALLLTATVTTVGAKSFSSLEERMSQRDFESAGLQKLSPEELAYLNRWLVERGLTASATAATAQADRVGLAPERGSEDAVRSRLLGSFSGWSGNTVFRLENGQVWQQTGGGSLAGVSLESPTVSIDKGMFGAWYLRVEGYNSRAKVKRIE